MWPIGMKTSCSTQVANICRHFYTFRAKKEQCKKSFHRGWSRQTRSKGSCATLKQKQTKKLVLLLPNYASPAVLYYQFQSCTWFCYTFVSSSFLPPLRTFKDQSTMVKHTTAQLNLPGVCFALKHDAYRQGKGKRDISKIV